jgi:2-dehydropantoate 2-reductase
MEIKKAMLIGLGAIGCVYSKLILENSGCEFYVIADGKRAEKIAGNGFSVNGRKYIPNVIIPKEKNIKADLIIFTVKNYQLNQAIKDISGLVYDKTVLITLLNGISARDEIKSAFPNNTVLYGVALEIDAVRNNRDVINSNDGIIEFGKADNTVLTEEVRAVKNLFDNSGIRNNVPKDMMRSLWRKWMINVGANQISAVAGITDPQFISIPEMNKALHMVMREVIKVAESCNINIDEKDISDYDEVLRNTKMESKTSMLQDIEAGRKTEVDYFAGKVIEYGKRAGVATPYNELLYMLIKGMEKK